MQIKHFSLLIAILAFMCPQIMAEKFDNSVNVFEELDSKLEPATPKPPPKKLVIKKLPLKERLATAIELTYIWKRLDGQINWWNEQVMPLVKIQKKSDRKQAFEQWLKFLQHCITSHNAQFTKSGIDHTDHIKELVNTKNKIYKQWIAQVKQHAEYVKEHPADPNLTDAHRNATELKHSLNNLDPKIITPKGKSKDTLRGSTFVYRQPEKK
jgi:hypothetical protein